MASYEWVQGNSAGPHTAPVTKLLLHTTEGASIEGAVAAYVTNNSWPHLTVDARHGRRQRICGHLGYDVAARSLKNLPGGVQTNTAGVIQIELVGSALEPEAIDWAWLGAEVVGPICRDLGIPVRSSVEWVRYPVSYGKLARQRLSGGAWLSYRGILGHQHAPENDHGDPGGIPIRTLLDAATPPTTIGRSTKVLDIATHPDGIREDLVLIATDRTVWHYYKLVPEDSWSPGESLGGQAKSIACEWSAGQFRVSVQGANNQPWEKRWFETTGWTPWVQAPDGVDMIAPADNL